MGEGVVLRVFRLTGAKAAAVGGCRVKQGKLVRNAIYRLIRDGEVRVKGESVLVIGVLLCSSDRCVK